METRTYHDPKPVWLEVAEIMIGAALINAIIWHLYGPMSLIVVLLIEVIAVIVLLFITIKDFIDGQCSEDDPLAPEPEGFQPSAWGTRVTATFAFALNHYHDAVIIMVTAAVWHWSITAAVVVGLFPAIWIHFKRVRDFGYLAVTWFLLLVAFAFDRGE